MNEQKSIFAEALTLGIIFGAVLSIYSLITYFAGIMFEDWLSYLSYVVMAGCIIWVQLEYRKTHQGIDYSYGKAWKVATISAIYAAVIQVVFTFLLYNVIDTDLYNVMLQTIEAKMHKNPAMTEEMISMAMAQTKKVMSQSLMPVYAFVGTVVMTMLGALITSIFTQKRVKMFDAQD